MTDTEHEVIHHDGVLHETDAAVLVEIDGEERWIPKSVTEDWDGTTATVAVWWLEKEGMI